MQRYHNFNYSIILGGCLFTIEAEKKGKK